MSEYVYFGHRKEEEKSRETFLAAINMFKTREKHLRGNIEFILSALTYLEEYGVHQDIEVMANLCFNFL